MTQSIDPTPTKKNKFRLWKGFLRPLIMAFVFTMIIQIVVTYINTYNRMWEKKDIPYNVKLEWALDNEIRYIRYDSFLSKKDGYITDLLQKVHFLIYQSAKRKIPNNDPFWIKFWEPASNISILSSNKIDYSDEIAEELITNLKLISSNKSKVESFNQYKRYIFVDNLYSRILENINYKTSESRSAFELNVLNASQTIIEDFFKSDFNFYKYKGDIFYSEVQTVPYYFISGLLNLYMHLIMNDKQESCNTELKELILDQSANYIYKDSDLSSLRRKVTSALKVYKQQYEEYCKK